MFTIYITLKSFESFYIKRNIIFLKNLFLLTKNNTLNNLGRAQQPKSLFARHEISIKDILGKSSIEQIEKTRKLKTSDKLSMQYSDHLRWKNAFVHQKKHGFFSDSALSYAKLPDMHEIKDTIQMTKKPALDSYVKIEEIVTEKLRKNLPNEKLRLWSGETQKINEINLPLKQKLFTVLRSVHVHKKSRLQFHFTWYIKKLTFKATNIKMMWLILYVLKNAKFYGVELEISLDHKTV